MLPGFKKGHHTVPDAANGATNAFLGKLCATDLADGAEKLFQEIRAALSYKRKDLALSIASPAATLVARDFTVDVLYALAERDPSQFVVTTTLHQLRNSELARTDEFSRVFAARFIAISFALQQAARVEAVIDAIENLEGERGLRVNYPSDYRECVIRVDGIDAEVRCTGDALDMVFPRAGAPHELMDGFADLRDAFQISKPLAGLIG